MTLHYRRERIREDLIRRFLLPLGDIVFGQRIMKRLRLLEEAQWWSHDRLYAHRDRQLQRLIATAYAEVPFYRRLMEEADVAPDDIRAAADLRRLPVATKDMLRNGYPDETVRKTGQRIYEAATSGSTGKNFKVAEDAETAGRQRANLMLALQWAGWNLGEPHMQTGMTFSRDWPRRLKDWIFRCHYVSAGRLDDDHLHANLERLEDRRIRHLFGFPGSIYMMARYALQTGWNQPMQSVVTWGDNLFPHYRRTIEKAFRTRVTDTYGCGEGIQISAQCGHGDTYHIHTLDTIVEIVDDDLEPVPAGTAGHVILTRLHAGPMPLIRYQIGDIATTAPNSSCSCGRGFDVMGGIMGRDTDIVVTPSGKRFIVHFFTGILEHFAEIDSFQVVQKEISRILVRIVPRVPMTTSLAEDVQNALVKGGADDITIDVEAVEEIPLTPGGKRCFVISELQLPPADDEWLQPIAGPSSFHQAG